MSCKPFKNQLEAYALGLLSDKQKIKLEQHLLSCSSCEKAFQVHKQASGLIEKSFDQEPPEYLRSKVMANLKDVKAKKSNWLYWAAPGLVSVIVLVLIVKMDPGTMLKQQAIESVQFDQAIVSAVPAKEMEMEMEKKKNVKRAIAAKPKYKSVREPKPIKQSPSMKLAPSVAEKDISSMLAGSESLATKKQKKKSSVSRKMIPGAIKLAIIAKSSDARSEAPIRTRQLNKRESEKEYKRIAESDEEQMVEPDRFYEGRVKVGRSVSSGFAPQPPMADDVITEEASVMYPGGATDSVKAINIETAFEILNGQLNHNQVNSELGKLKRMIIGKIKEQGHEDAAQFIATINQYGKAEKIVLGSERFKSEELNHYIVVKIKSLDFDSPFNKTPARISINIKVK